jgi:RNase adaptor protein for sRNA GlmZ degradation
MVTIKSYGFKFGRPEANIVFDASYFVNPWRHMREIKDTIDEPSQIGEAIVHYMIKQEGVHEFCEKIKDIVLFYDKYFPNENIQIAVCCSAGEYRSPAIVEIVKNLLPSNYPITIKHSENSKL